MEFLLGYEYIFDVDFDELKRLYEEMRKPSTIIGSPKNLRLIMKEIRKTVNKK